jgi:glutamyl-tRNA synthetase
MMPERPIGRLAPSPTGVLHLGNVRTFMCAWLAARSQGGRVILRIEDLEKGLAGFVLEELLSDLTWLGFDWDEGPVWTADDDAVLAEISRYPRARAAAAERAAALRSAGAGGPPPDGTGGSWVSAIGRRLPFAGTHGPYIQSLRAGSYQEIFDRLLAAGLMYPCTCERADFAGNLGAPHEGEAEPRYPGTCRGRWASAAEARAWLAETADRGAVSNAPVARNREPVWRFRLPEVGQLPIGFEDLVQGSCRIDVAASVGDFVVFKTPRQPAYQLAVVADDLAMGVNQVVRGDDLVPSTARQILLWRALSGTSAAGRRELPDYAHVPLLVGPDGQRLAKRHGDARLRSLRLQGTDPRQVIGSLAEWSGLGDGRPLSLRELAAGFSWERLDRARLVVTPGLLDRLPCQRTSR